MQSQSHPDDIVIDDETVFRAEKILKSRRKKGKMPYLVKWFDFPMSESTWEPEESRFKSFSGKLHCSRS